MSEKKNYVEKNINNEFNSSLTESTSVISKSEKIEEELKKNKSKKHVFFFETILYNNRS